MDDFNLDEYLDDLTSHDVQKRLTAVRALEILPESNNDIVRALEKTALFDADPNVQNAALKALASPIHQDQQRQLSHLDPSQKWLLNQELLIWQNDGLISQQTKDVLSGRLGFKPLNVSEPSPDDEILQAEEGKDRSASVSIKQLLLSDTSVNVALYLGAFFILAAAFILAALVEITRLPILVSLTVIFIGGSFYLSRRLPRAGFVLMLIGTGMLLVDALVVRQLYLGRTPVELYWAISLLVVAVTWAASLTLYRSLVFILLAYTAIILSLILFCLYSDANFYLICLALSMAGLGGLIIAWLLQRSNQFPLYWSMFIATQVQMLAVSATLLIAPWVILLTGETMLAVDWQLAAGAWAAGFIFYAMSDQLFRLSHKTFKLFALPAVACLTAVPITLLASFSVSGQVWALSLWVIGLSMILAYKGLSGEWLPALRHYAPFLFCAGTLMFIGAALVAVNQERRTDLIYLGLSSLVYLLLLLRRPRWYEWSAALVSLFLTYASGVSWLRRHDLEIFAGFAYLIPSLLLLGAAAWGYLSNWKDDWKLPLLLIGILALLVDVLVSLISINLLLTSLVFFIYSLSFAILAVLLRKTWLGYLSCGVSALALGMLQESLEYTAWALPLIILGLIFYLSGRLLLRNVRFTPASDVLRNSGLVLAGVFTMTAPFQSLQSPLFPKTGMNLEVLPVLILSAALTGVAFILEAVRLRNVWLGYPACLAFFSTAVTALVGLDVEQPQYYTLAAGFLALIMHFMLLRSNQPKAAALTGLCVVLIVLGTTFIQLVSSEKMNFFWLMFIQSLLLLLYGLWQRSRIFTALPILFSVLTVFVVSFSYLKGVSTAMTIGCTGILLLVGGILGLLARERLVSASEKIGQRLTNW